MDGHLSMPLMANELIEELRRLFLAGRSKRRRATLRQR